MDKNTCFLTPPLLFMEGFCERNSIETILLSDIEISVGRDGHFIFYLSSVAIISNVLLPQNKHYFDVISK